MDGKDSPWDTYQGDIQINLTINRRIWDAVRQRASEIGISPEELVRYTIGTHFGASDIIGIPVSPPSGFNPDLKVMANLYASTGMCKCRRCLKVLLADEILKGECSCGTKMGEA